MTQAGPKPSIAVIIPVRNGMPFLAEALESVRAQRYAPIEVVVVDDGSSDGSRDFALGFQGLRVRALEMRDAGPAAARNAGLRATDSDLVAFLDADDLWPANALNLLCQALMARPDAGFAQGRIRNFRESQQGGRRFLTLPYEFVNLGANLWRRSLFESIGPLDEDLRLCEDLDFFMRCWEQDIRKAPVEAVVLHYRRHPRGMTHGLSGAGFGTIKAYKKRMDRIRRGELDLGRPRHRDLESYVGTPPPHQDGSAHVRGL
jgi:glycosyltransferase involved in cell wall biosynthesis